MQSIQDYIATNHIQVVDTIPTVVPWPTGVYYKTESGLYVHVEDTGSVVNKNIPKNTVILIRYDETDMEGEDGFSNMNGSSDPVEIMYNNVSTESQYHDCSAWHEGLDFVGDGGHLKMIVPADIGWPIYTTPISLTAMFYELRYTFWK